jgi:hypothetical protein
MRKEKIFVRNHQGRALAAQIFCGNNGFCIQSRDDRDSSFAPLLAVF